jgi:hypothetical protein
MKRYLPRLVYLCLMSSLTFTLLQVYDAIDIAWIVIDIPLIICIALIIPFVQIRVYEAYDKITEQSFNLILASVYLSVSSLITFSVLFSIRLQGSLKWDWYFVFIPCWLSLLSFSSLALFLLPGFMHPSVQLGREGKSILLLTFSAISSTILISMWLNNDFENLWIAFIPVEAAMVGTLVACLIEKCKRRRKYLPALDAEVRAYLTAIPMCAFAGVRDLSKDAMPAFAILIPPIMYVMLLWAEHEAGAFWTYDSSEDSDEEALNQFASEKEFQS